jgi:hypothetical protein
MGAVNISYFWIITTSSTKNLFWKHFPRKVYEIIKEFLKSLLNEFIKEVWETLLFFVEKQFEPGFATRDRLTLDKIASASLFTFARNKFRSAAHQRWWANQTPKFLTNLELQTRNQSDWTAINDENTKYTSRTLQKLHHTAPTHVSCRRERCGLAADVRCIDAAQRIRTLFSNANKIVL